MGRTQRLMSSQLHDCSGCGTGESTSTGRVRLLVAAETEFAERGYSGASIAGIARRAGVGKSTVFHHFESKEALYLAVISRAAAEFAHTLEHVLSSSESVGEGLARFQAAHLDHMHRNAQVARLILRELQDERFGHDRPLIAEVLSANYTRLLRFLQSAQSRGEIRADADCEVAAIALFSANVFHFQYAGAMARTPELTGASDSGRFTQSISDLVLNGLNATESGSD